MVCNRIRSAKLRNAYQPALDQLKDPQFVTLTHRTVSARFLRATLDKDLKTFTLCKRVLQKQGIKLIGLRKVECTYDDQGDKFHPHLHLIIEGKEAADALVDLWISKHPLKTDL